MSFWHTSYPYDSDTYRKRYSWTGSASASAPASAPMDVELGKDPISALEAKIDDITKHMHNMMGAIAAIAEKIDAIAQKKKSETEEDEESPRRQTRRTRPRSNSLPPPCWHGERNTDCIDPGADGALVLTDQNHHDGSLQPWQTHLDAVLFFNNYSRGVAFHEAISSNVRRQRLRVYYHNTGSHWNRYFKLQCTQCKDVCMFDYGKWRREQEPALM